MIEFKLPDMSCGHCVRAVTEAVKEVDPAATVEVNLDTKLATVDSSKPVESFNQAFTEAGYPPAN